MISDFIEQFTYVGLFLILFAAGLGAPIPEELPIVVSGALAHQGVVRWWIALPVCLVGVLAGDVMIYWAGHHWGERILARPAVRRVLTPEREARLKERYRRHDALEAVRPGRRDEVIDARRQPSGEPDRMARSGEDGFEQRPRSRSGSRRTLSNSHSPLSFLAIRNT